MDICLKLPPEIQYQVLSFLNIRECLDLCDNINHLIEYTEELTMNSKIKKFKDVHKELKERFLKPTYNQTILCHFEFTLNRLQGKLDIDNIDDEILEMINKNVAHRNDYLKLHNEIDELLKQKSTNTNTIIRWINPNIAMNIDKYTQERILQQLWFINFMCEQNMTLFSTIHILLQEYNSDAAHHPMFKGMQKKRIWFGLK